MINDCLKKFIADFNYPFNVFINGKDISIPRKITISKELEIVENLEILGGMYYADIGYMV
ncbi:MAG: hypothetical protein OHK0017_03620 [Patescibacteria group bacterium]